MDPFELLKADHQKVAELFDKLEAARGKAKLDVFRLIKSELELHTHIEEKFLYAVLEKPRETHDLTLEAYEEHKVVKTLMGELSGAKSANDEWQAKVSVLRENVEHHAKEEENELFRKADEALSDEELDTIGNKMAAEKARKQGKTAPKEIAARSAKSPKASAEKPGLLSRLADFVGLGGKVVQKKVPAKKKTATRKASKAEPKKASSTKTSKQTSATTVTKRSSPTQALKRTPTRRSKSPKAGAKKTTKKRRGRK